MTFGGVSNEHFLSRLGWGRSTLAVHLLLVNFGCYLPFTDGDRVQRGTELFPGCAGIRGGSPAGEARVGTVSPNAYGGAAALRGGSECRPGQRRSLQRGTGQGEWLAEPNALKVSLQASVRWQIHACGLSQCPEEVRIHKGGFGREEKCFVLPGFRVCSVHFSFVLVPDFWHLLCP